MWSGCDAVFGLTDGTVRVDAASDAWADDGPPPCTNGYGSFGAPTQLQEAAEARYDPQLRGDLLELFFTTGENGDPNGYELAHMTRATVGDPFSHFELIPGVSSAVDDTDPTVSADGLDLMFKSQRGSGTGAFQVWEATRATTGDPFSEPVLAAGMPDAVEGIDLSPDGRTLYYDDGTNLYSRSRAGRTSSFGATRTLLGSGLQFPTIGPDELELFGSVSGKVRRRYRTELGQPFAANDLVDDAASDPDLAADGRTLVEMANGVTIRVRDCL